MTVKNKQYVFLVYRQGVYMQGVVGIFTDIEEAKTAAINAKKRETDHWHDFHIQEMEIGEEIDLVCSTRLYRSEIVCDHIWIEWLIELTKESGDD